jgi:hypothetical protein
LEREERRQERAGLARGTCCEPRWHEGPKAYSGKRTESQEFIAKCETVFTAQAVTCFDDATKLAYAVNLLENEAYEWVKPALLADVDKKPEYVQNWAAFRKEFFKMFSDVDIKEVSYQRIQALKQTGSASTYAPTNFGDISCISTGTMNHFDSTSSEVLNQR